MRLMASVRRVIHTTMPDTDARNAIIHGLKAALLAHHEGRIFDIGDGWDQAALLNQTTDYDDKRLSIALALWEDWADSAQHDWLYYDGMDAADWPRYAATIVEALERDQPITEPDIIERFIPRPPGPSVRARFVAWMRARFRPR